MNTKIALTLAALGCLTPAHGALLFYEGFDYAVGDLNGKGGWTAGTDLDVALNGTVTDTYSGSYASVTTTGGYIYNTVGTDSFATVALGSSVTDTFTDGATTWFSMVDIRGTNGANARLAATIGSISPDAISGVSITAPETGGEAIGMATQGNNAVSPSIWNTTGLADGSDAPGGTGRDRFHIAKIVWSDSGNDTIQVAFFDAGATITEAIFDATATATISADLDQSTFDTLSLASRYGHFDEIRIASDFESAISGIPEPSAALLGGLGLLALLRRRRN